MLAVDTATDIASVAVGDGSGVGSGAHQQGARRHATEIVRLIDFALSRAGVRIADLDGVVVGDGPGSFTGLRIGWAAAKGLVQESGADVIAVPSLMAAAAGAAEDRKSTRLNSSHPSISYAVFCLKKKSNHRKPD